MLTDTHTQKLVALAADIEDVLLHNELDDEDTETLSRVAAELLEIARLANRDKLASLAE